MSHPVTVIQSPTCLFLLISALCNIFKVFLPMTKSWQIFLFDDINLYDLKQIIRLVSGSVSQVIKTVRKVNTWTQCSNLHFVPSSTWWQCSWQCLLSQQREDRRRQVQLVSQVSSFLSSGQRLGFHVTVLDSFLSLFVSQFRLWAVLPQ